MKLIGLARIGRDAELRHTAGGDAVCNISLAFNYGQKGDDGKRPTTWVDASLWGKRAESLVEYLTKGSSHMFIVDDVHLEEWTSNNGSGVKLVGRVMDVTLGANAAPAPAPQRRAPAPAPKPQAAPKKTGFDDMDDPIPF